MQNTFIEIMRPLYNTLDAFTQLTFDDNTTNTLFKAIAGTGENQMASVDDSKEIFYRLRTDAARESLILNGFINRYSLGMISEEELPKILSVLQEAITTANDTCRMLKHAKNKTAYERYCRHLIITKNLNAITTIRQSINAYNSQLIDFSEIDALLSNFPHGVVFFDATVDNESLMNNVDIVIAKLRALLIKLKDGGVPWAVTLLNEIVTEPQKQTTPTDTSDNNESAVNELDQK